MGQLQVTQLQHRLEKDLVPFIDVSDLASHGPDQIAQAKLTRALAAFLVMKLTGMDARKAAASVTDGSGDNGIDAIALMPEELRIVVVQSKWSSLGKGSAELADMIKFREGLDDLVSLKWDKFNSKLIDRKSDIEPLLLETQVTIDVVFAHMGTGPLADEVRSRMDEYISDLNDPSETARFSYYAQGNIHKLLTAETQSPKINLTVEISDWGQLEGPPKAIYGLVQGAEVASWYEKNGRALLSQNVRVVLADSEVNESIVNTLKNRPEAFWYYNNGVTVLCDRITRGVAGGTDRRVSNFAFEGVSVVNGAQTVGALARANDAVSAPLSAVRVMVRFISLEGASEAFASEVTRATNTQNRIGGRDFLSLDPEQGRLRDEFAVDKLTYAFRSGESDPLPETGCSVTEASIALACNQPTPTLAVLAKREVGRLWDDISKAPYRQLFNAHTTYLRVWRSVQVLRQVDKELVNYARTYDGLPRGVAIHGNRLILHLIFRQLDLTKVDQPNFDSSELTANLPSMVLATIKAVITVKERDFPGYPASLFKNATKCSSLTRKVLAEMAASGEGLPVKPPDGGSSAES